MLIGIDLGTTNSLAAYYADGKPNLIPNRLGKYLTPSVVSVDENGTVLVGETAREYGIMHPLDTAKVFKRSMGTSKEFSLGNMKFKAEELSSLVIKSLKEDAETYLGCEITEAIISVPAYFNDLQRKATVEAGKLAGLNVSRIINEPTAAALAYGVGSKDKDECCLVFDLGGGTFDVSILEYFNTIMEVHAIAGDNYLGGEDFTQVLANMFLEKVVIAPETLDIRTMNEVFKEAEAAKIKFSSQKTVTLSCKISGEVVESEISIDEFEKRCEPLLERLKNPIERSIKDAGLNLSDIDRVILVGGSTRLSCVRKFVSRILRRFPEISIDPDTSVALGAAVQCGMKERNSEIKEVVLTDVCPFTLGTEVVMSNGIFDEDGHYLPIIERNTVIPVSKTHTLYTASDNQSRVRVKILQGESRMAKNNVMLGELSIPVPPGPKGKESIELTFTYDVNALLEVEVLVNSTGVKRKVFVQNEAQKISEEEAEARMQKLAHLKLNPRDEEENKLLILRGERLYEESLEHDRELINQALMRFENVLSGRNHIEIARERKEITRLFDDIEFDIN